MAPAPKKIHLTSRTYLKNWAIKDKVTWTDVETGAAASRDIENVGFRRRWWGTDPDLSRAAEAALRSIENDVTAFLRDPRSHWPVGELRGKLAQFVAIHVVRTLAWRAWFERAVFSTVAENIEQLPLLDRAFIHSGHDMVQPEVHTEYVFRQMTRLASLFASMHWTLVKFDGPLLATSDQPVTPVPMSVATGRAPMRSIPEGSFAEIVEFRMPMSPDIALVGSWRDDYDEPHIRRGSLGDACSLNASTIKQAERGWCRQPGTYAPRLAPPLLQPISYPLSPQLFPEMTPASIKASTRRRNTDRLLRELAAEDRDDVMRWCQPTRAA